MKELENKAFAVPVELKEAGEDGILHLTCYGLAFGNVDSYGDIILPTSCNRFLKSEDAGRLRFCINHDMHKVVGKVTSMEADEYGLKLEVDVLPTTDGKDLQILLKAGAIDEFSIGYITEDSEYDRDGHRLLKDITIWEVSAVSRAANPKAVVTGLKEEGDQGKIDLEKMSDEELNSLAGAVENEQYSRMLNNL